MMSDGRLCLNTKTCMYVVRLYEGEIVPTVLYGAETLGMRCARRRNVNLLEIKYLRSLVGVTRIAKWFRMKRCVEGNRVLLFWC